MKLLNWRTNPDDPNSFLAEYSGAKFEVMNGFDEGMDDDNDMIWSYAYILPQTILGQPPYIYDALAFFDHHFQYDTKEEAMKEAERFANDIKNGDE